ncbi:hypothetical protein GBN32_12020 [Plesiomonas shigelloides]|uniref:hypothetical protein n=1 Tax=Plesiomonas shigelloides TaxID=703 RepID=UPI0012628093|nr:hypothetical protein [Plesiomonas shigelloides]KAB7709826.1 hypothetical protein GBN32_12020 [Plesiomonas shigelloides]
MSNKKTRRGTATPANNNVQKTYVVRKMEPSYPIGIRTVQLNSSIIIDFVGDYISEDTREAFSSIILTESAAKKLASKLNAFIERIDSNNEQQEQAEE